MYILFPVCDFVTLTICLDFLGKCILSELHLILYIIIYVKVEFLYQNNVSYSVQLYNYPNLIGGRRSRSDNRFQYETRIYLLFVALILNSTIFMEISLHRALGDGSLRCIRLEFVISSFKQ